jgi:hypothetical protein
MCVLRRVMVVVWQELGLLPKKEKQTLSRSEVGTRLNALMPGGMGAWRLVPLSAASCRRPAPSRLGKDGRSSLG